ncbi:hypothetical protein T06_16551 [Trichinella sp. T6]|nr:hypothetical protein T06_16551 [Trichinella sp. T6]
MYSSMQATIVLIAEVGEACMNCQKYLAYLVNNVDTDVEESAGPFTITIPWSEPPPRPTENILRDKPGPTGKCKAAMTIEDVFHAQLSSDIIKLIVLQTNEEGERIFLIQ